LGAIQIVAFYSKLPTLQKAFMNAGMKFLRLVAFAPFLKSSNFKTPFAFINIPEINITENLFIHFFKIAV
jgi:hypothetical protein